MSKPSFENIDRWFFEYTEGNLSPAQIEEFETFLSQHPELRSELDLWEDARVEAPNTDEFAVSSLRRPVVPYGQIMAYAGIAIILFLSGFFAATYFQDTPQYLMTNTDTSIITVEDEPLFAGKVLKSKDAQGSEKIEVQESLNTDESLKTVKVPDPIFGHWKKSFVNVSSIENSKASSTGNKIEIMSDDQNDGSMVFAMKSDVKSEDLPEIIDYLNGVKEIDAADIAEETSTVKKADMSKTFKRKLRSVFRKIKRMADQPIALKNTKDQYFHVPMMTGFASNYGMVGSARGNRLQLTTRNQWAGHANQQLQNTVSWDGYVYALRGGLGVDVSYNDYQKNAIQNYSAALTYSPKFSINKNVSIEPALRFKMGVIDVNNNSPVLGSNIELNRSNVTPLFANGGSPIGSSLWYRDVGAGIMLNTKWFYAGLNVDNIGRHYNNYYSSDITGDHRASTHLTGMIGTEYESMTKDMKISGYALFQNNGDLTELWGGVNAQYKWIQGGVATSSNLGVAASLGVVFDKVSLHYNLDNTYSMLKDEKLLSHQLTMRILMKPSRYAAKFLNM
tara:strand:+ start:17410 stop:19095 length:1686 start_codon:yes stop_codon:yes gene_type:complete